MLSFTLRERITGDVVNLAGKTVELRAHLAGRPTTAFVRPMAIANDLGGRVQYTLAATDFSELVLGSRWRVRVKVTPAPAGSVEGDYPEDRSLLMVVNE